MGLSESTPRASYVFHNAFVSDIELFRGNREREGELAGHTLDAWCPYRFLNHGAPERERRRGKSSLVDPPKQMATKQAQYKTWCRDM
jgi:hypothetical protein